MMSQVVYVKSDPLIYNIFLSEKKKEKKLSREERKIEAYMKAFERMERLQQRRQEHQAKQAHRRESEPTPGKDEDKNDSKVKRRK